MDKNKYKIGGADTCHKKNHKFGTNIIGSCIYNF